jgi:two-component system response regulator MprA
MPLWENRRGGQKVAKIKIVDDDLDFTEAISIALKEKGHEVSTCDCIDGAIGELISDKPDLLILDVMFPDKPTGGFELARKIRKTSELRNLPVILLTSINDNFPTHFSSKDTTHEWMPVQDFVEKPLALPKLLDKVQKMLSV